MSTTKQPLTHLWSVVFQDGHIIDQPEDDRYSKHVEGAEHNFSSFRDVLDYQEKSPIEWFHLLKKKRVQSKIYALNLRTGEFVIDNTSLRLEIDCTNERKLIFYRDVEQDNIDGKWQEPRVVAYNFGYEYKDAKGKVQKKVITLNG